MVPSAAPSGWQLTEKAANVCFNTTGNLPYQIHFNANALTAVGQPTRALGGGVHPRST